MCVHAISQHILKVGFNSNLKNIFYMRTHNIIEKKFNVRARNISTYIESWI